VRTEALCLILPVLLAACAATPVPPPHAASPAPAPLPAPACPPPPLAAERLGPADLALRAVVGRDLALRALAPEALTAELTRLEALAQQPAAGDAARADLAQALLRRREPGDAQRAQELLEAAPGLEPGARAWLQGQAEDLHRQDEAQERLGQQRREALRTIQQLSEKLDALVAIERRMTARVPSAPAPAAPAADPAATRSP
jgi:hypothetical protein